MVTCDKDNVASANFLFTYLKDNIIGLLLTLLAINTATLGLVASKIQDITTSYPKLDFTETTKQMKLSLLEQIILISLSVLILIFQHSELIHFNYKDFISHVVLVSILVYSVNILWDTGESVFVIIDEIQEFRKKQ